MAKATELVYTEKEIDAINKLKAINDGEFHTLAELEIPSAIMVSLGKKAEKFPDDANVFTFEKCDVEVEYTAVKTVKAYRA